MLAIDRNVGVIETIFPLLHQRSIISLSNLRSVKPAAPLTQSRAVLLWHVFRSHRFLIELDAAHLLLD